MIKEISFCVNKLVNELGVDYNGKGEWNSDEFEINFENKWEGRTWLLNNNLVIELKFSDKLYLIVRVLSNET